jgi:hypothetical protein
MGVHFKAGGAHPLLNVPASELHGTYAPLAVFCGDKVTPRTDRSAPTQNHVRSAMMAECTHESGR